MIQDYEKTKAKKNIKQFEKLLKKKKKLEIQYILDKMEISFIHCYFVSLLAFLFLFCFVVSFAKYVYCSQTPQRKKNQKNHKSISIRNNWLKPLFWAAKLNGQLISLKISALKKTIAHFTQTNKQKTHTKKDQNKRIESKQSRHQCR